MKEEPDIPEKTGDWPLAVLVLGLPVLRGLGLGEITGVLLWIVILFFCFYINGDLKGEFERT